MKTGALRYEVQVKETTGWVAREPRRNTYEEATEVKTGLKKTYAPENVRIVVWMVKGAK